MSGTLDTGYIVLVVFLCAAALLCIYRLYLQRLASPFEDAAGLEELLMEQGRASAEGEYLPPVVEVADDRGISMSVANKRSERGRVQSQVWKKEKAEAEAALQRMEAEEVRYRKSLNEETIVLEEEDEMLINKRVEALQKESGVMALGVQPLALGTPARTSNDTENNTTDTPVVGGESMASTPASDSNATPTSKLSELYEDAVDVVNTSETIAKKGNKKKKKKKKKNVTQVDTPGTPSTKLGNLYDEAEQH